MWGETPTAKKKKKKLKFGEKIIHNAYEHCNRIGKYDALFGPEVTITANNHITSDLSKKLTKKEKVKFSKTASWGAYRGAGEKKSEENVYI